VQHIYLLSPGRSPSARSVAHHRGVSQEAQSAGGAGARCRGCARDWRLACGRASHGAPNSALHGASHAAAPLPPRRSRARISGAWPARRAPEAVEPPGLRATAGAKMKQRRQAPQRPRSDAASVRRCASSSLRGARLCRPGVMQADRPQGCTLHAWQQSTARLVRAQRGRAGNGEGRGGSPAVPLHLDAARGAEHVRSSCCRATRYGQTVLAHELGRARRGQRYDRTWSAACRAQEESISRAASALSSEPRAGDLRDGGTDARHTAAVRPRSGLLVARSQPWLAMEAQASASAGLLLQLAPSSARRVALRGLCGCAKGHGARQSGMRAWQREREQRAGGERASSALDALLAHLSRCSVVATPRQPHVQQRMNGLQQSSSPGWRLSAAASAASSAPHALRWRSRVWRANSAPFLSRTRGEGN
jgi:LSD1 subclass zinc finger protein